MCWETWFRIFKSLPVYCSCSPEQSSDLFFGKWRFWELSGVGVRGGCQHLAFNKCTVTSSPCYWWSTRPSPVPGWAQVTSSGYSHQIINLWAEKRSRGREPGRGSNREVNFHLVCSDSDGLHCSSRLLVVPALVPEMSLFSAWHLCAQLSQTCQVNYHCFPASKVMLWFLFLLFPFSLFLNHSMWF